MACRETQASSTPESFSCLTCCLEFEVDADLDDDVDGFSAARCRIEFPIPYRSQRASIETLLHTLRHAHGSDRTV